MNFKYQYLAVGGTFDRLHLGHKNLLEHAFKLGQHVSIGITRTAQDKLLNQIIESFETRKKVIEDYLKSNNWLDRSTISLIDNIYGTTLKDHELEALVVTTKTYPNALKINHLRRNIQLKPLKIVLSPLIKGDDTKVISSERIRLGEIDRQGHLYSKVLSERKKLRLPESLREKLRLPLGKVFRGTEKTLLVTAQKVKTYIMSQKPTLMLSVGDIITSSLLKAGLIPDIQIIDYKSRRKGLNSLPLTNYYKSYINDPGTLNYHVAKVINKKIKIYFENREKQQIIIKGEEDLIALLSILLAPLQSVVVYGHYELGVIVVQVTEEKKKEVEDILLQFN